MEADSRHGEAVVVAGTGHSTESRRDKELGQEVRDLTRAVERLAYEIHRVGEKDDHEREKIVLRLENELLRFERRLLKE